MKAFLIYAAVGILFVLWGFGSIKKTKKKVARCTAPAIGRVVRLDVDRTTDDDGKSDKTYTPVFQYIVNGETVEASSNISSNRKKAYKVGDSADILFNPSNPREFVIKGKSEKSGKGAGAVIIVFGLLLIVLGITQIGH